MKSIDVTNLQRKESELRFVWTFKGCKALAAAGEIEAARSKRKQVTEAEKRSTTRGNIRVRSCGTCLMRLMTKALNSQSPESLWRTSHIAKHHTNMFSM